MNKENNNLALNKMSKLVFKDYAVLSLGELKKKAKRNGYVQKAGRPSRKTLVNYLLKKGKDYFKVETRTTKSLLEYAKKEYGFVSKRGRPSEKTIRAFIKKKIEKRDRKILYKYTSSFTVKNNLTKQRFPWKPLVHIFESTKADRQKHIDEFIGINHSIIESNGYCRVREETGKLIENYIPEEVNLAAIPMKRAHPKMFAFITYPVEENHSEEGHCVYDFCSKYFNKSKQFILDLLKNNDMNPDPRDADLWGYNRLIYVQKSKEFRINEETKTWKMKNETVSARSFDSGVSAGDLICLCRKMNVKMLAFTMNCEKFIHYNPIREGAKDVSHHYKPLVFNMMDEHMYPITDNETRLKLMRHNDPDNKTVQYRNKTPKKEFFPPHPTVIIEVPIFKAKNEQYEHSIILQEEDEKAKEKNQFYDSIINSMNIKIQRNHGGICVKMHDLNDIYLRIIQTKNEYCKKMSYMTHISSLGYNNCMLYANPDINTVLEVCEKFNIPFKNQTTASLLLAINERNGFFNVRASSMSPNMQKVFDDAPMGCLNDCYTDIYKADQLVGIDMNNCHVDALINTNIKWPIFDSFDEGKRFIEGEPINESSFYFVEINTPLFKTNLYPGESIGFFEEEKYTFTIKQVYHPSHFLKPDYFKRCILSLQEKLSKNSFKAVALQFIGCLNKVYANRGETIMCPDIPSASFKYLDMISKVKDGHVFCENIPINPFNPDTDYVYFVSNQQTITRPTNNKPIYLTIINRVKLRMLRAARLAGGELVGIKTDKLMLHSPINIAPLMGDEIGKFKIEDVKTREVSRVHIRTTKPFPLPVLPREEWKTTIIEDGVAEYILEKGECCFVNGEGGCGKTFQMKRLMELLEGEGKTYRAVAFTNQAALNLNGTTLNKNFQVAVGEEYKGFGTLKKWDYLIIDEISMVPSQWYDYFIRLKKKGSRIICVGDFRQLPPVEGAKSSIETSNLLKTLCDNNRILMQRNYRYDEETANKIKRGNLNEFNIVDMDDVSFNGTTHVVYKNSTKNIINKKCMEIGKRGKRYFTMKMEDENENKQLAEIHVYKGLPLICVNPIDGMVKGTKWIVDSINLSRKTAVLVDSNGTERVGGGDILFTYFEPAYATTVHKMQGCTINGPYYIWDSDFYWVDEKWTYTALSRCTDWKNINIVR